MSYRDDEGISFHVCDNALQAAEALRDLKLVDDITMVGVKTEMGAIF